MCPQVIGRVLGHLAHRTTALAWQHWQQQATNQRQLTSFASMGVRRMLGRTLALALGRWQESLAELRRLRQVRALQMRSVLAF
jgi:hypothetical protein